jgi:hypothetical protein
MGYLGFCKKYDKYGGCGLMMAIAYLVPPTLVNTFLDCAMNQYVGHGNMYIAGGVGFLLSSNKFTHRYMSSSLRKRGVGITEGSKLVQKWQATIYALPLALTAIYNIFTSNLETEKYDAMQRSSISIRNDQKSYNTKIVFML